ncbi:hypothetical protein HDR61_04565 [bacterium]|nr:hypothetical protein [bacterium]
MSKIKNVYKSILISGIVVPAMGVVAHLMPGKGTFEMDDASLAHRFETAYSLRPGQEPYTYTSYECVPHNPRGYVTSEWGEVHPISDDGRVMEKAYVEPGEPFDTYYSDERYLCNPFMIYGLHFFAAWGAYAALKRREKWLAQKQQSR